MTTTRGKRAGASETDPEAVERYLDALTHPLKSEVEGLRRIFLKADRRITEGIKWNVPSFYSGEWFATFDLRSKEWIQLVFHRGAQAKRVGKTRYVQDTGGILQWITNDRCTARFVSKKDVADKAAALAEVVVEWTSKLRREVPTR